jgi:hypothetical protein
MKTLICRRVLLGLMSALLLSVNTFAQQPRLIREPALGVEFKAPEGWQYQKNEMGYVMGHNSIAGVILVTSSPYLNLDELIQGAYQGIQEEGGTLLQLKGEPVTFGNNGLAGNYQGTLNWQQVTAYAIGLISPLGGTGVSCMIITTPNLLTENHKSILESMANSFNFFKPEIPDEVKEWEDWFKTPGGCRLKYLSSSGSSNYGGGYTGSSSEATIDLCPNGSFRESSSSEFSMSIDAGSAYSDSNDGGVGQWKLSFDGTNPVLVLNYNDGQTAQYALTYIDKKTYLNDTRYFVLFNEEGPQCY